MPTPLEAFRAQYPQYDDLSDEDIVKGLHAKDYSDLDYETFRRRALDLPEQPIPEGPPPLLQRAANDIASKDGEWKNILKPEPEDRSDIVSAMESVAAGITEQAERVIDLGKQVIGGWHEYMANRATAQAFEAAQEQAEVPDIVAGRRGGVGLGVEQYVRQARVAKARDGDPEAQRQILQELAQRYDETQTALQSAIDKRAKRIAAAREIPFSEVTGRMMASDTFSDAVETLSEDPIRIATEIAARSLPNSSEGLVLGAVGALTGGVGGLALGAAAGSAMTEYRASFAEALEAEGVNLTDSNSILEAIQDPDIMGRVTQKSLLRAGIIGTLDGAAGGLAAKNLTPFVRGAVSRIIANQGAQVTTQAALGAAGEAGAQLATEGEIRPGEVLAEGIGEGPTAIFDSALATVTGVTGAQAEASVDRVVQHLNKQTGIELEARAPRPDILLPPDADFDAKLATERERLFREAAPQFADVPFADIERLMQADLREILANTSELGSIIAKADPEAAAKARARVEERYVSEGDEVPADIEEEVYDELALGTPSEDLTALYERISARALRNVEAGSALEARRPLVDPLEAAQKAIHKTAIGKGLPGITPADANVGERPDESPEAFWQRIADSATPEFREQHEGKVIKWFEERMQEVEGIVPPRADEVDDPDVYVYETWLYEHYGTEDLHEAVDRAWAQYVEEELGEQVEKVFEKAEIAYDEARGAIEEAELDVLEARRPTTEELAPFQERSGRRFTQHRLILAFERGEDIAAGDLLTELIGDKLRAKPKPELFELLVQYPEAARAVVAEMREKMRNHDLDAVESAREFADEKYDETNIPKHPKDSDAYFAHYRARQYEAWADAIEAAIVPEGGILEARRPVEPKAFRTKRSIQGRRVPGLTNEDVKYLEDNEPRTDPERFKRIFAAMKKAYPILYERVKKGVDADTEKDADERAFLTEQLFFEMVFEAMPFAERTAEDFPGSVLEARRPEPLGYAADPALGKTGPGIHSLQEKRNLAILRRRPATTDLTGALEQTLARLEAGETIGQITGVERGAVHGGSIQIDDPIRAGTARATIGIQGIDKIREELGEIAAKATKIAVLEALSRRDVVVKKGAGDTFRVVALSEDDLKSAVELAHSVLSTQTLSTPYGLQLGLGVEVVGDITIPSGPERKKRGLRAVWGVDPNPTRRMDADPDILFAEAGGAGANWVDYIGLEGDLPLNANGEYVLGNGRTVRIPKTPINKRHILQRLEKAFGLRIYRGKMKSDMLQLGFFRIGTGEIRIRDASETEVAAHEFGHWLDFKNPWIRQLYAQYADELLEVSYRTDKLVEGYAEFMRLFFTQDREAQRVAPGFYDAFRRELEKHPEVAKPVYDIQEMMHAWAFQGVRNRAIGRFADSMTAMDKIKARLPSSEDLIRRGLDGLRTIRTAEQFATDGESIQAYNMLRVAQGGSASVMHAAFHYATPAWNDDFTAIERSGEALTDVFGGLFGDEELGLYMLGRHAQDVETARRLKEAKTGEVLEGSGFRPDEIEDLIKIGQERPEFVEIYDRFLSYVDRILDFAQQSGLLSEASLDATRKSALSFVPLHRVIESIVNERPVKPGSVPGRDNVDVIWENMLGTFSQIIRSSLINAGMRKLFDTLASTRNQKGARWATKIPNKKKEHVPTKKALETVGLTKVQYDTYRAIPEAAPEEVRAALADLERLKEAGNPIVEVTRASLKVAADNTYTYYDKGKRQTVEIGDPGLIESIQSLAPHQINMWTAMLGGASTMLRRGVTSTPSFAAANLARDTLNAWTQTKGDRLPVVGAVRGVAEALGASEMYQDMLLNGGGFANFTQAAEQYRRYVVDPRAIIAKWDDVLGRFENANRFARYRAGIKAGETGIEAAIGARDISTDFSMRGSSKSLRTIFTVVPFMNARIQGLWRLARIHEDGLMWSYAGRGLALMIAGLGLYALNRGDERYEELPDEVRDLHWVFFTGPGEDDIMLMPKPFETGMVFGTIPERMFELLETRNGKEFADALSWMFLQTFALDMTPQAFKPFQELGRNRNFAGAPIIPEHTVGSDPGQQWSYYTSESLRRLGRKYPKYFSPAAAQHLIRGYLGTLGGYALAASDATIRYTVGPIDGAEPPAPSDSWRDNFIVRGLGKTFIPPAGPPRRTKSTTDYYDMVREVEQVVSSITLQTNREPHLLDAYLKVPENALRYGQNQIIAKYRPELAELRQTEAGYRQDTEMSGEEKRVKIWETKRAMQALHRSAVAAMRQLEVESEQGGQ